jgi:hypothetical protein
MSEDYFRFCKQHGMNVEYLIEPDANHYTMSEHLLDDRRPLTQAMIKLMEISTVRTLSSRRTAIA